MRQRMKLTGTNRSCGLTTYFPPPRANARRGGAIQCTHAGVRGAPGDRSSRHIHARALIPLMRLVFASRTINTIHQNRDLTELDTHPAVLHTSFLFFLAAIPKRSHPFPSRTRKLSSSGPMVLQGQPCGRVGRCRGFEGSLARVGLLLFSATKGSLDRVGLSVVSAPALPAMR